MKTKYEMTEIVKENEVLDCPNHRDKICILNRLKKTKHSSSLVQLEMDKPVLSEIQYLRGKLTDKQLEAIKDVLDRNHDVF